VPRHAGGLALLERFCYLSEARNNSRRGLSLGKGHKNDSWLVYTYNKNALLGDFCVRHRAGGPAIHLDAITAIGENQSRA
jgi:hypothetical protein